MHVKKARKKIKIEYYLTDNESGQVEEPCDKIKQKYFTFIRATLIFF